MRALAIAAMALAGVAAMTAPAFAQRAQVWDDDPRLTFTTPSNVWFNYVDTNNADVLFVASSTPTEECHIFAFTRAETANRTVADLLRIYANPIAAGGWETAGQATLTGRNGVTVTDARVDTASGFWPIQRATLTATADNRVITAALTARPGIEYRVFCSVAQGVDAQPSVSVYEGIINSVSHSRDVEWRAQHEATLAAAATPAAPPTN